MWTDRLPRLSKCSYWQHNRMFQCHRGHLASRISSPDLPMLSLTSWPFGGNRHPTTAGPQSQVRSAQAAERRHLRAIPTKEICIDEEIKGRKFEGMSVTVRPTLFSLVLCYLRTQNVPQLVCCYTSISRWQWVCDVEGRTAAEAGSIIGCWGV
jgi:hypothetical protein